LSNGSGHFTCHQQDSLPPGFLATDTSLVNNRILCEEADRKSVNRFNFGFVEPYDYGIRRGAGALLGFQIGGESQSYCYESKRVRDVVNEMDLSAHRGADCRDESDKSARTPNVRQRVTALA
jgi:hypothetical protein